MKLIQNIGLSIVLMGICNIGLGQSRPLFTPDEQEWIRQNPVVRYVVDRNTPPIEYIENGEYRGLSADYLRALERKSGLHFELIETADWHDAQEAFLAKKADLFANVARARVSDKVADQLFFTDPYFSASSIIVTRPDVPVILNLQELNGKTVAVREHGAYSFEFARRHPEFHKLLVPQHIAALEAVANGTAYAAIGPDAILLPMMRRQYTGRLGVSGTYSALMYTNQIGVRADMRHLRSIMVKSLASLSAKETDVIDRRWLEQADFGKPSLLSIVKYRAPALFFLLICIALLGIIAYRARVAKHAKSRFLAIMSHEIRTPLNAILGNLELLEHSSLSEQQRDRLKTIKVSSDGLLEIISDILDFSKIEAGELALEKSEFDVVALAEQALLVFAPLARAKGLTLYAKLDTATGQMMHGDPGRLRQIIHNLLSNAIKFSSHGRVGLHIGIERTSPTKAQVVLSVADTGIGMTPKQQRKLFRPFSQADSSISRRFGGSGLGLSLAQQLASAMGGTISVRSELGVGSCFTLRLPLGSVRAAQTERPIFSGEPVVLLSSSIEWRDLALPHLEAWGLTVQWSDHPSKLTHDRMNEAAALIIYGMEPTWTSTEENILVEDASYVVDCSTEGPAQPSRTGRVISVSCFSLKGLQEALRLVLQGEAQSVNLRGSKQKEPASAAPFHNKSRRLRVLVAEDNPVNQHLINDQLSILGCDSNIVASGSEALNVLRNGNGVWDLLLTDLNMPGMDGYELASAVRQRWPHVPIIAVTADATEEEHARCRATGMQQVLTKPLALATLHDALAAIANQVDAHLEKADPDVLTLRGDHIPAELRATFKDSCTASLRALNSLRQRGDTTGVLSELHSLSGALAVFGQKMLAKQSADLGRQIRLEGLAKQVDSLVQFETAVQAVVDR